MPRTKKNRNKSPLEMLIVGIVGLYFTFSASGLLFGGVNGIKEEAPRIFSASIYLLLGSINIFLFALGYKVSAKSKKPGWQIFYALILCASILYIGFACWFIAFFELNLDFHGQYSDT